MKILVAYKWAPNPQDATVGSDGVVDWKKAKSTISEYDPIAIEVGRNLADATGSELIGITVGGKDAASPAAKKGALSRGLDAIYVSSDDSLAHIDTAETAARLAQLVNEIGDVDLVLTGDVSVDEGVKLVPPTLAGILGWPCLAEVTSVSAESDKLSVARAWNGGTQTVEISGPAVLAISADAATPRIPGMKDILAAGKKPSTDVAPAQVQAGKTTIVSQSKPAVKERKKQIFDSDTAVADLVSALKNDQAL